LLNAPEKETNQQLKDAAKAAVDTITEREKKSSAAPAPGQ